MQYFPYILESKKYETEGTHIYTLRSADNSQLDFIPGQYIFMKDPEFRDPDEAHPFSITSLPGKTHLEFCIKQYGDWTESFAKKPIGSNVFISQPQGVFTFDKSNTYTVFLLGGIGISPFMSMLRWVKENRIASEIVMIYGNRTPETIAYAEELKILAKELSNFRLIHIFSHLPESHQWEGYRGFITKAILENEVDFSRNPNFYFIGPPIFIQKIDILLLDLGIIKHAIKTESLEEKSTF